MDGFSYHNIFDTKGIEYLVIIAFLLLIIPFWISLTRRSVREGRESKLPFSLSAGVLDIPLGLFHCRNHTWTYLMRSGNAKIGLDDFLIHITGNVRVNNFKKHGDFIFKGEIMTEVVQDGKILTIYSPLSGKILTSNEELKETSAILNSDPYGKGWLYEIMPVSWIEETRFYYLAQETLSWMKRELSRFKDFVVESVKKYSPVNEMLILQDGGELCDKPLSELPSEIWQDFQKSFLN